MCVLGGRESEEEEETKSLLFFAGCFQVSDEALLGSILVRLAVVYLAQI